MKIYLAPMEGITTYIFRNAFEKYYGGVDKYFTPFLTASHLKGKERRDVDPANNKVSALVPQILTNDSDLFIRIVEQLMELGYREVNLNLGCPSGTVTSKGRGAGFLDRTEDLDRFLYEIYERFPSCRTEGSAVSEKDGFSSQNVRLSVKTRIGMEFLSEWDDILDIYKKYPISELIVHPRLRNEFYTGEVHVDQFLKSFKVIPGCSSTLGDKKISDTELCYNSEVMDNAKTPDTRICYNGDITDVDSFNAILHKTEQAFRDRNQEELFMIGRGALKNPELPSAIKDSSGIYEFMDMKVFREFIREIMEGYITEMSHEKQVVMKMKELWSYFALGLGLDKNQLREIHKATRLSEYKSAVQMILTQIF